LRNGALDGAVVSGIWNAYGSAERRNDDGFAPNDDYSSKTFVAGVQAAVNPRFSAGITARYNSNDLGIPYNINADSTAFVPSPNRRQSGSETQISVPLQLSAAGLHYDLRLGDNEHAEHFKDPDGAFGPEFGDTDISTRTGRLSIQPPSTPAGVFTFGGDLEHSHVDHTDSFGLDVRDQSRDSHALFIEDRASLPAFGSRLEIAAGARYDHFDTFGSQISPRVALAFLENSRKWRIAYGQGFRAPAIGELYAPFFGNPDLDAEHSDNFEVGFDQYVRSATVSITAFHASYRDLITYDTLQNRFGNIDRANARGIELAASRAFGDFHAAVSYTWQKVVDAATDEQLVRRPKNSGSLSLAYDRSAFSSELVVTYAGERRDVTDLYPFGFVSNGAYSTADIVLKYQVASVAPFVKVENATDERYEEVFGYPSPRRRFIAGIRYSVR
jgi:outer membrane cobalamin receptor